MPTYQHSYSYDALSPQEWGEVIDAIEWLMRNCPDYSAGPGAPYPNLPLRDHLITASFADDALGGLMLLKKREIDHSDPSFTMPIRQRPHLVFNGAGTSGSDYFTIEAGPVTKTQTVDTGGKPYDLLVCATLILANHLCPNTWKITSTAPQPAWKDALALARGYRSDAKLPTGVVSDFAKPVPSLTTFGMPAYMDFRR